MIEQAVQRSVWLAVPLLAGVAASAGALMLRARALAGASGAGSAGMGPGLAGAAACLAGALLLGLAMPAPLAAWLAGVAAAAR